MEQNNIVTITLPALGDEIGPTYSGTTDGLKKWSDNVVKVLTEERPLGRSSCIVYMDGEEEEWKKNYKEMGEKVITWYLKTKDEKFKEHMGIIVHR